MNQRIRTPLKVGGEGAVFYAVMGEALVASGEVVLKHGRGRRGRRFMCTSFGASPVAALTNCCM